jgi:hypothetical protein
MNSMKSVLAGFVVAGLVFAGIGLWWMDRQSSRHAAELAALRAAAEADRAALEEELATARARARQVSAPVIVTSSVPVAAVAGRLSPQEIIARLQTLRVAPGANAGQVTRQAVYWLEELAQAGPAALPAIRDFLALGLDTDLDTSAFQGRGLRDRALLEWLLPPSLRFGLFEVVRRIGGADGESILADCLSRTGRGVELAWLARALQDVAPNKYREPALAAARALLAGPATLDSASPLDRSHREHLFGVLSFFGDAGYAGEAQAQLVRTDSQVDREALRYLQQTLGAQSVTIAAQAYQNPWLTNSAGKEPLARLALAYVGVDAQANTFYQQAINDPQLTQSHRKNLIEDLNEDGFPDRRNLAPRDLPMIENRMTLIEQLAPSAMDDANAAAFQEAYKDLVNMRARITGQPPASIRIPTVARQ